MKKTSLTVLCSSLLLVACAEKPQDEPVAEKAAPPAAEAATEVETPAIPRTASAEGARVFFISPTDGETVRNPVRVEFGIEGMTVVPAGDDTPHSGHHHLLIDAELPDLGLPIPKTENYVHFGDGSTSTEISLEPGEHTLQMLLGDHLHIPHDPPLTSDRITVYVE